jgi:hypothetical protein
MDWRLWSWSPHVYKYNGRKCLQQAMNEVFVSAGESPVDPVKGVPIRDFVFLLASATVGHLHFLFSKEGMLELSRSIMFDNLWIYIVAISAPSIKKIINQTQQYERKPIFRSSSYRIV